LALIMMGSNDALSRRKGFETYMRQIIEYTLQQGVIPILATKADNLEGDNSINRTIALLAHQYDVPLWNFWLAVQPLPDHGLQNDGVHLTFAKNHFDDPLDLQSAWPIRNLTALQVLDAVWRSVAGP
jgi:lysophospholipase L1-like esterase